MSGSASGGEVGAGGDGTRMWSLLDGYGSRDGPTDLLLDGTGRPRPAWTELLGRLATLSNAEIEHRFASADRHIRDTGISYRVYGQAGDRSWPLGSLPLVMDAASWGRIAQGVAQRAELMERILADLYGEGRLVSDGLVPAALVAGSPEYLRPLQGVRPPGGRHLHLYAADLGLGPDGAWRVLADKTQAPSGAGYSLNNRLVLARAFPDIYTGMSVERLAPFFQAFRAGLASVAERNDPRICILSSGPDSQTYVEQAYLARYLGFLLVEGDDLIARDGRLHVRTVAGLKRADALWRRVDSNYVDPLELEPGSRLGVPGLIETLRNGSVVVGNMPGSGLMEAPAFAAFLPALSRHLLGEEIRLRGLATAWCGQPAGRREVLDRAGDWDVLPAYGPGLRHDARDAGTQQLIVDRPGDYAGQERVQHGTAPVWLGGHLEPRPFVMRVFATATPDGWRVMPGAFCRMATDPDADPLTMTAGVESADLWIVSDAPVGTTTLLPQREEVRVRRVAGHLPSRAADNLFWLGRYLERAECVVRLVRCLLNGNEAVDLADRGTASRITGLLEEWSRLRPGGASPVELARTILLEKDARGSVARHIESARLAASSVRERLSAETWRALSALETARLAIDETEPTEADLLNASATMLRIMAALSGLSQENMNRAAGWRFLDMGRRIERAINTCRFARVFASPEATADDLDVLLKLVDSQISYGARYILGVSLLPVRDMALLDPFNPRSVAFQIEAVATHLAALPALREDGLLEPQRRLATGFLARIATTDPAAFDRSTVAACEGELETLAEAIGARYFPGGPDAVRPEPLTTLA